MDEMQRSIHMKDHMIAALQLRLFDQQVGPVLGINRPPLGYLIPTLFLNRTSR